MVLIEEDHLAGVYGVNYCESPSSRAVILCGGEPRVVVGVKVTYNDDVVLLLLK